MKKFIITMILIAVFVIPSTAMAAAQIWNDSYPRVSYIRASGDGATYTNVDSVARVAGGTHVVMSAAGHGFYTNAQVTIKGTTNYDGTHTLTAVTTDTFTFAHAYTAETLSGATVEVSLKPTGGDGFQFFGFFLSTSTAASTAEELTVTVNSNAGASFDCDIYSKDLSGVESLVKLFDTTDLFRFVNGTAIDFTWANTDGVAWAIEILYRQRQ